MATAGRAVVFSGTTVAIGLALLLLVPVPFVRSLGVGGFVVPLASIVAAATLQPALLSLAGRRGARRVPVAAFLRSRLGIRLPVLPGTIDLESGFWARLARAIMRRPVAFLAVGTAILLALAAPAFFLHVTPGSVSALPQFPESVRGLTLLRSGAGAGALTPTEIVVDAGAAGRARSRPVHAAIERLGDELFHDPEVSVVALGRASPYVAPGGRYARVIVVGRHEYGDEATQAFVRRLRSTLVPAARFPAGVRVVAGGGPPQGVDYLSRSYGAFPWLVLGVLVLTYLVLLRAFRSLVLPLKAVVLERAHGRGRLRDARRHLPLGRRRARARPVPRAADRGLDPDLPLRHAVRPLDGLRGLPRVADARVVGSRPRQRAAPSRTASSGRAGSSPRRR